MTTQDKSSSHTASQTNNQASSSSLKKSSSHVPLPTMQCSSEDDTTTIKLSGRLDHQGVAAIWDSTIEKVRNCQTGRLVVDMDGVDYMDISGASLVTELQIAHGQTEARLEIVDLAKEYQPLLKLFAPTDFTVRKRRPREFNLREQIGMATVDLWKDIRVLVAFVGELSVALMHALLKPARIRWKDVFWVMETAGVNALPIIALIGFLMGLIMAFQSAVPLQRFGADIFVANMLTISLIRELGPLVTAILLAGRSGSAFAAEIGTMTVNEEVNALKTMGIDPLAFLAVPRVLATMLVTPVLTIFFNLFALLGGSIVVVNFGYSFVTYVLRVQASLSLVDLWGGLFKAWVFSLLVSGIGCQRGLMTGTGSSAVGASTTSSVVSGLILIAISDGIMAVMFYAMGI